MLIGVSQTQAEIAGEPRAKARVIGNPAKKNPNWTPETAPRNGGRPKHLTTALERRLADPAECDAWVAALARKAKRGDVNAFREGADRTEGKVAQAITGADGDPLIPASASALDEVRALLEFARQRAEKAAK